MLIIVTKFTKLSRVHFFKGKNHALKSTNLNNVGHLKFRNDIEKELIRWGKIAVVKYGEFFLVNKRHKYFYFCWHLIFLPSLVWFIMQN